ncbi:tetratricopeptide repeat protein [Streptomyces sp. NPDC058848]|uniref:tetratricopeptide repeat protein n=1 Tax=unclassified Streptomyces TaxID=2593676 RepID=UPI0036BFDC50
MSRLGRDRQREHEDAERSPGPAPTPIDVRVPAVTSAASGGRSASVDGSPVVAAPGEEIQNAVLNRLHRLAVAAGRPVLATIHDERIGCSVPLRVDPDGSSHLAGEPAPTTPKQGAVRQDSPTHVLRSAAPVRDSAPTFRLSPVPEPQPAVGAERAAAPGTVAPPTGAFGPPPRMDGGLANGGLKGEYEREGARAAAGAVAGAVTAAEAPTGSGAAGGPFLVVPDADPGPKPTPTPARGFDAVAEAVLGDGPLTAPGDATAPALLAEPTARINEAVKEGRTEEAARLAEQAVADASGTLGPEHAEVLRLRELTAYIAYLSGDPDRAFRLCLDLARIHRRAGDAEAAYGNVQSAATAWRAVRDPASGLELGHDLVGLWGELAAEDGPAAEDAEELESARTRMGRLTERAARAQAG